METNMGTVDRLLRMAIGLGLLALVAVGPESKLGLLGLIPLLSGAVGYSPLYRRLQVDTVKGWHHRSAGHTRHG